MGTRETTFGTGTQLSASVADLGSITRSYPNYFNAFPLGFVLDEVLQLKETPIANPIVHSLSSLLFSYPFEVFHHYFVPFEFGNDVFTDVMVNPNHEPFFSSRELLEKSLAGTSAFGLESATQISELPLNLFDFCRTIELIIRSDCDAVYSEVNAENNNMRSVVDDINLFGECEQEECSAFSVHSQETLFKDPTEIFPVTIRNVDGEILSLFEQSKGENVSFEFGTSWEVISDRSVIDDWFGLSLLDYSTGLFDASDGKLSRKSLPQSFINERMKPNIIADSFIPSCIDAELQLFNVNFDGSNYFLGCADFDFNCDYTTHTNYQEEQLFKLIGGEKWQFLPSINARVSLLRDL